MVDLSFLDNVEKILIVAGTGSILAATTAPNILGITWTAWSRRGVATAGIIFLVLALPWVRGVSQATPQQIDEARQNREALKRAVVNEVKLKLSDLSNRARHDAYVASTHIGNNAECVSNSKAAMTSIENLQQELNAFVVRVTNDF